MTKYVCHKGCIVNGKLNNKPIIKEYSYGDIVTVAYIEGSLVVFEDGFIVEFANFFDYFDSLGGNYAIQVEYFDTLKDMNVFLSKINKDFIHNINYSINGYYVEYYIPLKP